MLKTYGRIKFIEYGQEPITGYASKLIKRLDFRNKYEIQLIGNIETDVEIQIFCIGEEYAVKVIFFDIDINIINNYPEMLISKQKYHIMLGSKTIGEYTTDSVEFID